MLVILDSSVATKWFVPERHKAEADAILQLSLRDKSSSSSLRLFDPKSPTPFATTDTTGI